MKRICLIIVLLVSSLCATAQSNDIIESLARVGESGSRVVVNSDVKLKSSSILPSDKFKGYRVRIFFDNKQTSRSDAAASVAKFKELYPSLNTYTEYVPPYFKVTAGDFLTRLEAVALWGKIKYVFPTAFVVSENIPYLTLLEEGSDVVVDESQATSELLKEADIVVQ